MNQYLLRLVPVPNPGAPPEIERLQRFLEDYASKRADLLAFMPTRDSGALLAIFRLPPGIAGDEFPEF